MRADVATVLRLDLEPPLRPVQPEFLVCAYQPHTVRKFPGEVPVRVFRNAPANSPTFRRESGTESDALYISTR